MKKIAKVIVGILVALALIWVAGRYGWHLFGFRACSGAGIQEITVTEQQVEIKGFYPGSFPKGFIGCHAREKDGALYVGFRFSGLFGIFETGQFDLTIPVEGEINRVYLKTSENEFLIWEREELSPAP